MDEGVCILGLYTQIFEPELWAEYQKSARKEQRMYELRAKFPLLSFALGVFILCVIAGYVAQ